MDWNYEIALTEVDEILKFTDTELVNKIPMSFKKFIKKNKNKDYKPNITPGIPINEQVLKKETEAILSLIFRSYWATEEEKRELEANDENYISTLEAETEIKFPVNNKANNTTKENENMQLMNIEKVPWYKKIYYKILKLIHKN